MGIKASDAGCRSPRPGRNDPCHCGSHRRYKRCCQTSDERAARAQQRTELPSWVLHSRRKLHQFLRYVTNVYGLVRVLGKLSDSRRRPEYSTFDVVITIFLAGLLRRPSMNAMEGDLKQADFQKLIGRRPKQGAKLFSAEVISNVLDKLDLSDLRHGIEDVFWTAERNKGFRAGSYGSLRCVALDGWEPFCSYDRHCPHCLTREVSVKSSSTGKAQKRTQYYHRYVVAMLLGPSLDVALDIEPVLNAEARRDLGEDAHHEGELTAAHRLLDRLHQTYGTFLDAFVLDALYANGPIMTKLDRYGYGGFIVLKKDENEPLKEALALWKGTRPCQRLSDDKKKERLDLWDADDIDTLDTYPGKTRVIRAVITKKDDSCKTWCFALVGARARKVSRRTALTIVRSRWHIENTGFGQWVKYWNLGRVFRHTPNAIQALLLLWILVFNLLQLFIYRRLRRQRKPNDPCDTILAIVAEMFRDTGALLEKVPWEILANAEDG